MNSVHQMKRIDKNNHWKQEHKFCKDSVSRIRTINMERRFAYCPYTYLELSNLNNHNIVNMDHAFEHCESLESIDFGPKFKTSNVTNMNGAFTYCESLKSLDLDCFDTSRVTDMGHMFSYCKNLKEIDLSSFNTSKVMNMDSMFCGCNSLTSLDLGSFDTIRLDHFGSSETRPLGSGSNLIVMDRMFAFCRSLVEIKLGPKFRIPESSNGVFMCCSKLKFIRIVPQDPEFADQIMYHLPTSDWSYDQDRGIRIRDSFDTISSNEV